ncbi:nucleotide-diphospho-sugar transferase [Xylaria bambusicola]|uniref:nucleotide-diphospho-sugar transferase n=1 Tax=Xylaria bambusicola TaxID=326684 RepID=UPI002007AA57|nr:nucleotide-diphospho-sugar transferase [Xylaria bambusicola]KAI0515389.1 nucleotide-diphospho-sugar transferase [Xylaria bambusicola]
MAARGGGGEDVYATLLLTDTYLPGALVLAHSLRDAGTKKKLAALVTLDTVSAEAITELKSVYDYILPVPRIRNAHPTNLELMNRTDLHSAFTKINLWKQTQYHKIVYLDADVVAYRAPDELFDITHPFSAAPDIGWPDLFNTGVMVLTPNMGDYYAMMAMAERGISFDGADQGLINTHFRNNYNRISFAYNVTPSAHYQYVPAYRHFQSSINMVHFIGSDKPWFNGRHASVGSSPFDEITGRWWAVYDRHYRTASAEPAPLTSTQPPAIVATAAPVSELVQYLTKGEYQPKMSHITSKPYDDGRGGHGQDSFHGTIQQQEQPVQALHQHDFPSSLVQSLQHHGHHDHSHEAPVSEVDTQKPESSSFLSSDVISFLSNNENAPAEAAKEQIDTQEPHAAPTEAEQKPPSFEPSMSSWDAQRHPPPTESKPEAMNFPATVYEMSKSTAPFVPPQHYPSPPKNMWYEVPKEAPAAPSEPPKPIFPWETHRPKPSRVFVDDEPETSQNLVPGSQPPLEVQTSVASPGTEVSPAEQKNEIVTPTTPTITITSSNPWTSYTRTNAWDDLPEIERYVDSLQKSRTARNRKTPGMIDLPSPGEGARGSKLTDFPSEVERPSLPVTPAPIRRSNFWGGGSNTGGDAGLELPSAAGVPGQNEWDPVAQLQELAKKQSEELLKKLGGTGRDSSDLPPRLLPFGSEELVSPTYVAQSARRLNLQPVTGSGSSSSVKSTPDV